MIDNPVLSNKFQKCTSLIPKFTISRRNEMNDFKEFSNSNDLSLLVYQKLVEQNIISTKEKLLLNPYYNVNLHGNGIRTISLLAYIQVRNFF